MAKSTKTRVHRNKQGLELDTKIELDAKFVARKLRGEIDKLKTQVDSEVWLEICRFRKQIKKHGISTTPIAHDINGQPATERNKDPEDYEVNYKILAEQIRKQAEKKIANRKNYAAYGNINSSELVKAYCSNPKLRNEFDSKFQWFVSFIIETFPDSPIQNFTEHENLRNTTDEQIDRIIRDTPQKETEKGEQVNGGNADSSNEKISESWLWKLYEKTIKAAFDAILDKLNPS